MPKVLTRNPRCTAESQQSGRPFSPWRLLDLAKAYKLLALIIEAIVLDLNNQHLLKGAWGGFYKEEVSNSKLLKPKKKSLSCHQTRAP
jgi:hypothetical protein